MFCYSDAHSSDTSYKFKIVWYFQILLIICRDQLLTFFEGLEYLHIGCRPSMVHSDVKSTNILLDQQLTAKIADFGLSRSFQLGDESHISTVVAGTPGYLDPE